MAEWKKIITSGSNAELSQITASVGIDLPNDSISGDKIEGGTIGSTTINSLGGSLSLGDFNITNVGSLAADNIVVDEAGTGLNITFGGNTELNKITLTDNLADALNITEAGNSYIKFTTTNSSEKILVSKDTEFLGDVSGSITSTGSFGTLHLEGSNFTSASLASAIESNAVTSLNNQTENRLVTIGSTTTELDGEANLLFDGTDLTLIGNDAKIEFFDENGDEHISANNGGILSINAGTKIDLTATDVDISGNTTIGGNLTVNGVTTTVASTNTEVKDQFLFLNSGSNSGDGGIIVQNGSHNTGSAFIFDDSEDRWAFNSGSGKTDTTVVPHSHAVEVVTNNNLAYKRKNGNIRIEGGEIFIYVE